MKPITLDPARPVASLLAALAPAATPTTLAAAMDVSRGTITTARDRTLDGVSVRLLRAIAAAAGKGLEIRLVDLRATGRQP
jgi:hypothetical protein